VTIRVVAVTEATPGAKKRAVQNILEMMERKAQNGGAK
jgi:hypothetical protein